MPRFCMWCTSGGTYQWEQKTNEAVSTSLGAMVLALPIPMIASPERTDGRTDDLLKKAAISLGTVRSQKTSLGQLKRPRESQQKNNWLPVRCCSSATCEMCLLRCGILLACVRACVRACVVVTKKKTPKGELKNVIHTTRRLRIPLPTTSVWPGLARAHLPCQGPGLQDLGIFFG